MRDTVTEICIREVISVEIHHHYSGFRTCHENYIYWLLAIHFLFLFSVTRARDPECFTMSNGQDYRGVVRQTISGYACQRWNVQTPHGHSYTPAQYPGILGNHNHCRNPGTFSQPWCYTTNPRIIREYCDVGNPRTSCATAAQTTVQGGWSLRNVTLIPTPVVSAKLGNDAPNPTPPPLCLFYSVEKYYP